MIKAGTGFSNAEDAFLSGKKNAEDATRSGGIKKPDILLAFCGGQLDHDEYFRGLQSVVGNRVPIIGGSAAGVITNDCLSYKGYPSGAAAIQSDSLQCRVSSVGGVVENEKSAGKELASKLSSDSEDKLLLTFYDSIKTTPTQTAPPLLNSSQPLIEGIEEMLSPETPIIGAGLVGDYEFNHTKQFCGTRVEGGRVVGAILGGGFQLYFRIMHGCAPLDGVYHKITKKEGAFIFELDGRPIVGMIDELYGNREWRRQHPVKFLTIGMNMGEKYDEPDENKYVNRLITGVLPDESGIGLFEPGLEEGMEIQFMLRDTSRMIESTRKQSEGLMERVEADGRRAAFGLYIDCAGRAADFSNTLTEEAAEVQRALNRYNTPLLGFYSGVEVAPFLGSSIGLDWTGVLMILAGDRE